MDRSFNYADLFSLSISLLPFLSPSTSPTISLLIEFRLISYVGKNGFFHHHHHHAPSTFIGGAQESAPANTNKIHLTYPMMKKSGNCSSSVGFEFSPSS